MARWGYMFITRLLVWAWACVNFGLHLCCMLFGSIVGLGPVQNNTTPIKGASLMEPRVCSPIMVDPSHNEFFTVLIPSCDGFS